MWISVKDELPPKFKHVLCYFPKRGFEPYIQISYKESNGSFADEFKWGKVTHWMPLPDHPAPYERDEEYGQIAYHENEAMFVVQFDTWLTNFDHMYGKNLEVIGNIHDNPELFKGGAG